MRHENLNINLVREQVIESSLADFSLRCASYRLIQAFLPLNPWEWLASNFSLPYHTWIKHYGQENKGADHWLKKLLIVGQILHVSILGNVYRIVWRICILMLGCKGLCYIASGQNPLIKFDQVYSCILLLLSSSSSIVHHASSYWLIMLPCCSKAN